MCVRGVSLVCVPVVCMSVCLCCVSVTCIFVVCVCACVRDTCMSTLCLWRGCVWPLVLPPSSSGHGPYHCPHALGCWFGELHIQGPPFQHGCPCRHRAGPWRLQAGFERRVGTLGGTFLDPWHPQDPSLARAGSERQEGLIQASLPGTHSSQSGRRPWGSAGVKGALGLGSHPMVMSTLEW